MKASCNEASTEVKKKKKKKIQGPVNRTQERALSISHWPNLGQFKASNKYDRL